MKRAFAFGAGIGLALLGGLLLIGSRAFGGYDLTLNEADYE